MSERTCATCRHWTPPTERTGFADALTIHAADYSDRAANDAAREAQVEADKTFGTCKAIGITDLTIGDPIPLATTRDASDYIADLFTRPEFGCAMHAGRELHPIEEDQ